MEWDSAEAEEGGKIYTNTAHAISAGYGRGLEEQLKTFREKSPQETLFLGPCFSVSVRMNNNLSSGLNYASYPSDDGRLLAIWRRVSHLSKK